ncbi:hypothetical protein IV203_031276 [Nitzschia inconspicua]|uniref:Uncharacterized protein n=1 Tax=Nitzschia inconspicua TaxID=303405 RepID=A0A9K3Q2I2_9STRA|nr:hypothetical protein IV203_031276 [Nitzschia inconspicua]
MSIAFNCRFATETSADPMSKRDLESLQELESIHTPKRGHFLGDNTEAPSSPHQSHKCRLPGDPKPSRCLRSRVSQSLVLSLDIGKRTTPFRLRQRFVTARATEPPLFLPMKKIPMTMLPLPFEQKLRNDSSTAKIQPFYKRKRPCKSLLLGSPLSPRSLQRLCKRQGGNVSFSSVDDRIAIPVKLIHDGAFALKKRPSHDSEGHVGTTTFFKGFCTYTF